MNKKLREDRATALKRMSKRDRWQKCYKVDCTPPLEVFKDFIRFYGENIDIKDLNDRISKARKEVDTLMEVRSVWEKHFGIRSKK